MKRVLLLLLVLSMASPIHVAAQTASPPPTPLTADTSETLSGVTFTAPKDWSEKRTDTMTILSAPENARIIIVHVGAASDAKAAVAGAWKLLDPTFARKVEIAEPSATNHGWDERAEISYVTSPDEHRVIVAEAYRKDASWTVLLADGSASAFEKRGTAIGMVVASVQPEGYVGETFVGKTANRLTRARVKELIAFVKTGMADLHVPGVGLALIDHGKIVYEGGLGVRTMGSAAPVDKNTLFMEPVTQAFPTFRLGSPATTAKISIADLVCACTGVPRKDYDWLLGATPKDGPERTFKLLAESEPTSKYGELFQYGNTMASAAGYIAGDLEYPNLSLGSAYDTAMLQQLVFNPLGMSHTTFDMNRAFASDHASPHDQDIDGTMHVLGQTMNQLVIPFRPAGAEWSSPHDMIQYVQNELTEGILPNGERFVSQVNLLQRRMHTVAVGAPACGQEGAFCPSQSHPLLEFTELLGSRSGDEIRQGARRGRRDSRPICDGEPN